jgi:hypothetical protein
MAKFRKKPVMIEAVRFFEKGFHTVPEDICLCIKTPHGMEARPHIHTLEGTMLVSEGDWVITGVQGEQYPCKPDIFEKTYEPVIEADQTALKVPNDPMLQFFMYGHLPPHMQAVSRPFCELAIFIVETLPRNPERTVALRKLLEAKDCAVRAVIYKSEVL